MLKVLEDHFGDEERLSPKLAYVRSGTGTMDLANDLQNLALLYEDEEMLPILKDDQRFYDPYDVSRARRLASHIFESLGLQSSSPADRWTTLTRAALSAAAATRPRRRTSPERDPRRNRPLTPPDDNRPGRARTWSAHGSR